jgi:hypothetical protein
VSLRAPKDTVESLRLTLQRLEQFSDPAHDAEAKAQLKRILMIRIANLEALEALRAETLGPAAKETARSSPARLDAIPPSTAPDLCSTHTSGNQPPAAPSEPDHT